MDLSKLTKLPQVGKYVRIDGYSHSVYGCIFKTLICGQISSGMVLNNAFLCVSIYKQDVLIKLRIKVSVN